MAGRVDEVPVPRGVGALPVPCAGQTAALMAETERDRPVVSRDPGGLCLVR